MPDINDPTSYTVFNNVVTSFLGPSGNLLTTQTGPSEVINTKQFGLNVAPGYDVTIGHYFCRDRNNNDHFVEFSFWGLNSWSNATTVNGYRVPVYAQTAGLYDATRAELINLAQMNPVATGNTQGSLRTPFPMAGTFTELPDATDEQKTLSLAFNYGTQHVFAYRSTMNNFELNGRFNPRGQPDRLVLHPDGRWRYECRPATDISYLYGMRLMQIDETFNFLALAQDRLETIQRSPSKMPSVITTLSRTTL